MRVDVQPPDDRESDAPTLPFFRLRHPYIPGASPLGSIFEGDRHAFFVVSSQNATACGDFDDEASLNDVAAAATSPLSDHSARLRAFEYARLLGQLASIVAPICAMLATAIVFAAALVSRLQRRGLQLVRAALVYNPDGVSAWNGAPVSPSRTSSSAAFAAWTAGATVPTGATGASPCSRAAAESVLAALPVTAAAEFAGSFVNAGLVVASVYILTLVFVAIFRHASRAAMLFALRAVVVVFVFILVVHSAWAASAIHGFSVDAFMCALVAWNVAAVVAWALAALPDCASDSWLFDASSLCFALALAWPFFEFPPASLWATMLALGVYDLFAVLTPCGPLRQVFRDRAQTNEPPLPVLMYRGTAVAANASVCHHHCLRVYLVFDNVDVFFCGYFFRRKFLSRARGLCVLRRNGGPSGTV